MTFDEAIHWIAQGAINIDEGLERVEKDSYVHKAMHRLCDLVAKGRVKEVAELCPVCEGRPSAVRDLKDCPRCHGKSVAAQ